MSRMAHDEILPSNLIDWPEGDRFDNTCMHAKLGSHYIIRGVHLPFAPPKNL